MKLKSHPGSFLSGGKKKYGFSSSFSAEQFSKPLLIDDYTGLSGWWFQTCFIFHFIHGIILDNPSH